MSNEHELLELEPNTSLTNRTRTEHPKSSVRFVKLIEQKMLFELVFGKLTGRAYRTRTRTEPNELTEQFGSFTALVLEEENASLITKKTLIPLRAYSTTKTLSANKCLVLLV